MDDSSSTLATSILQIEDADPPGRVDKVKRGLESMPGIRTVEINYVVGSAKVR